MMHGIGVTGDEGGAPAGNGVQPELLVVTSVRGLASAAQRCLLGKRRGLSAVLARHLVYSN